MLYFGAALAFLAAASFSDLKSREVPPFVSYGLFFLGLALHAAESFALKSPDPLLFSAGTALLAFVFAYGLYVLGVWAGGDVKLFTGLGAMLPVFNGIIFFPFIVFAVSLIAILPFSAAYITWHFIKMKKLRRAIGSELKHWLKTALLTPIFLIAAYELAVLLNQPFLAFPFSLVFFMLPKQVVPGAVFLAGCAFILEPLSTSIYFAYAFAVSLVFFIGWASLKLARKHVLRQRVPTPRLEPGMISAQDVFVEDGRTVVREPSLAEMLVPHYGLVVSARSASGLTGVQILGLKKLGVRALVVRRSLPFVPILALGLALAGLLAKFFI